MTRRENAIAKIAILFADISKAFIRALFRVGVLAMPAGLHKVDGLTDGQ